MSRFSTVARIWSQAAELEEEREEPEAEVEVAVVVGMLEIMVAVGMPGTTAAVVGHPAEGLEEPERTAFLSRSIQTSTYTVWERIAIRLFH